MSVTEEVDMTNVFAGGDVEYDTEFEAEALDDGSAVVEEPEEVAAEAAPEPEPEAAAEPEPEAAAEEEPAAAASTPEVPDEDPAPRLQVPKDRLDTEIAKRRALESELEELKKAAEKPDGDGIELSEVDAEALMDAVASGDVEKFKELYSQDRAQIARDVASTLRTEMRQNDDATVSKTLQQQALENAAQEVATTYDVFNDGTETYDATLTDELIDMRDFYISRGQQPADALRAAASTIASREGLLVEAQTDTPPAKPARDVKPNVQHKMEAAQSQPASLGGESNGAVAEPAIDIWSMSETELERLSEKDLAVLRGDVVQ